MKARLGFACLALLGACGPGGGVGGPNGLASAAQGTWITKKATQGAVDVQLKIALAPGTFGVTSMCSTPFGDLSANATALAEYTPTDLRITTAAGQQQVKNGVDCSVNIKPMTGTYAVNGDSLTLTLSGQTEVLTRISQ